LQALGGTEKELSTRPKRDKEKVKLARCLRGETTMTFDTCAKEEQSAVVSTLRYKLEETGTLGEPLSVQLRDVERLPAESLRDAFGGKG
jgi:hypothetical protein